MTDHKDTREFYLDVSQDDRGMWVAFLGEKGESSTLFSVEGRQKPTTMKAQRRLLKAAGEYLKSQDVRGHFLTLRVLPSDEGARHPYRNPGRKRPKSAVTLRSVMSKALK